MVLGATGGLLDGGFIDTNVRILGWIIREKVSHVMIIIKNHGAGFSCGISLRRGVALFL